jgi:hypothetical protein
MMRRLLWLLSWVVVAVLAAPATAQAAEVPSSTVPTAIGNDVRSSSRLLVRASAGGSTALSWLAVGQTAVLAGADAVAFFVPSGCMALVLTPPPSPSYTGPIWVPAAVGRTTRVLLTC